MQRVFTLLTLLSTLGFLSGCSSNASSSASISKTDTTKPVPINSMRKGLICIAPNVFVDPAMPEKQRQEFLQTVNQSRSEISNFFGGLKSSPNIFACSTSRCFNNFGGVMAKAKTINDDTVLLSKRGLDKTTLSHELAHAEFHKLLGTPHVWNKVPMWFDEGLAILACKDHKYSKPVAEMPLQSLVSHDQWVNAIRSNKPAYNVARQAVEKWYLEVGTKGLQDMINRLKNGEVLSLESLKNHNQDLSTATPKKPNKVTQL